MSNDSSSDYDDEVPVEILEAAKNVTLNLLPTVSRQKYTIVYNEFKKWRSAKKTTSFAEDIFLAYFDEISKKLSSATLWSRYSMLKSTIQAYDNIDLSIYKKLMAFLKKLHVGHKAKKAKVFTASDVAKFCDEAPDDTYLAIKVALVIGVSGACRRAELTNMKMKDIEDHKSFLLVRLPQTKTKIERSFTVNGDFYTICQKYIQKRPVDTKSDRFFLGFRNGKYFQQPLGINTIGGMPQVIAKFLNLPNPETYTGHTFRRTSATLLVDSGGDITELKRHGGWKSNTVAEGYVESSLMNKRKIGEKIISSVTPNAAIEPEPKRLKTSTNDIEQIPTTSTASHNPQTSVPMECSDTSNDGFKQVKQIIDSNSFNIPNFKNLNNQVAIELNNCNVTFNIFDNKK